MKKINIALIGYGYWGKRLCRYLKEEKGFNLKYVCTRNNDKIWADESIEAVVIATPIDTHYKIAKMALLMNKHVLCEKPLSLKVEEVLELKKIAEQKNLLLLVPYNLKLMSQSS